MQHPSLRPAALPPWLLDSGEGLFDPNWRGQSALRPPRHEMKFFFMRVTRNAWPMCGNHEDCLASNRRSDSRHLGGGPGPSRTSSFVLVSTGQGEVPTRSNRRDCGAIKTVDRMSATISEVTVKRQNILQICLRASSMHTQFRQDSRSRDAVSFGLPPRRAQPAQAFYLTHLDQFSWLISCSSMMTRP